jgi:hypothetical protein
MTNASPSRTLLTSNLVNQRLTNVINDIGDQWNHAERTYGALHPTNPAPIGEFWREWSKDFFDIFVVNYTQSFVRECIRQMRMYWGVATGETAFSVLETLRTMEDELANLSIDTRGFN